MSTNEFDLHDESRMVPALRQTEGWTQRAGQHRRPCPARGCGKAMRMDSLCCRDCWRRVDAGVKRGMMLAESYEEYDKHARRAMKALGCDDKEVPRLPHTLPRDEISRGWTGRYPDTVEIVGSQAIRKLQK